MMWSQATRRFASSAGPQRISTQSVLRTSNIQQQALKSSNVLPAASPLLFKGSCSDSGAVSSSTSVLSAAHQDVLKSAYAPSPAGGRLPLQSRSMFDWALRPYAFHSAVSGATGLSTLNAGFSNVGLSLLVCPWKALPTVLAIAPMVYLAPAVYKLLFSNCSRGAVNSVFSGFCQFTMMFLPVPAFENLFAELTFYIAALSLTFFMYNLLPELMLEDSIWMFYCALFVMPFLPLAFAYMPTFVTRSYLIL